MNLNNEKVANNNKISLFNRCVQICFVIFLFASFSGQAQENQELRYEVETDPIAYIFKGYSAHLAVTYSGFRYSVGIFGLDHPKFLLQSDAFTVFTSGFDIKTDYLFGSEKGFYAGLQATYNWDRIALRDEQSEKKYLSGINIGVRTGYRFMFGKQENQYRGFYITPWVALMYNPSPKTTQLGTEEYKQSSWVLFPTVHLGWRF